MASILEHAAVRDAALPITVEQYHRLGESGIIDQRTELLHGVIVEKMVKSPEHSWLVQQLVDWLRAGLDASWQVRQEQPLTFADSEPEPDIAVVHGSADDFRRRHPQTAALVIEVALRSEAIDRQKANTYAQAGIDEFWLVLPHAGAVECFTEPTSAGYAQRRLVQKGDMLNPLLAPALRLAVEDLLQA